MPAGLENAKCLEEEALACMEAGPFSPARAGDEAGNTVPIARTAAIGAVNQRVRVLIASHMETSGLVRHRPPRRSDRIIDRRAGLVLCFNRATTPTGLTDPHFARSVRSKLDDLLRVGSLEDLCLCAK